jgi:acyl-coenzyme A synthetase/AMP-(fatty) acid ligase
MSLSAGAAVVLPPALQAAQTIEAMNTSKTTVLLGVPFHYELLATESGSACCGSLRMAVCGGEILQEDTAERFLERFGVPVGQAYGTSETGMLAADLSGCHPGTVGKPLAGIDWSIKEGELLIRLPQSPYAGEEGGERYRDGWLHTRDAAEAEPDTGLFRLQGRLDSIRIIGGLKVDALEVERRIALHPAIEDVRVIFTENDRMEAYIVGKEELSMSGLLAWCRDHMAAYKIPRMFHHVVSLPATIGGKKVRDPAAVARSAPWQPSGNSN